MRNMKKIKKWASVLMAGAMVLGLAGCNSGGTTSTTGATGKTEGGNTATEGDKVTLEFYAWLDEEGIFTKLTEEYKKVNPNVEFNLHFVPTSDYETKLLTAFSGGADIDCFAIASAPSFAAYQNKDQVYCIDELVAKNQVDTSGFQASYDGLKVDGKAYVLPYKTSSWVVFYNKDVFDAAGVEYPTDDWTWEEYAEIAGKLTSGEGAEKVYGSLNYQPTSMWWRIPANSKGATNPMDEAQLDEWMKAAEFHKTLSDNGHQPPYADRANEAGADYTGAFLQGNYGMMFNGDWEIEMLNTAIAEGNAINYDIAALPHWEGEKAMTTGTPAMLAIAKNSEHPEEAFEFMQFASGQQGAEILVENDYFPAWSSDEIVKAYTEGVETPEHIEYIVNQEIYPQVPCDPLYNTASNIVKEEVSLYLLGEQDLAKTKETILSRYKGEIVTD